MGQRGRGVLEVISKGEIKNIRKIEIEVGDLAQNMCLIAIPIQI